jgi:hypothetical protein
MILDRLDIYLYNVKLSVLLSFMDSDYLFGIFQLFFILLAIMLSVLLYLYNVNSYSGCDLANKYFKYFDSDDIKRIIA